MRTRLLSVCVAATAAAGCDNAGELLTPPPPVYGGVVVSVYLDRDASGAPSAADTVYEGARVVLFTIGGSDTVKVATTDDRGLATFDSIPVGRYDFVVDPASVGDSLPVVVNSTESLRLVATRDSAVAVGTVRLGYREVTLAEARSLPAGRRVMVRGVVVAPFQHYSDSSTFLGVDDDAIRVTGARHVPGRTINNVGDSVLVLGTSGSRAGQPVIIDGLIRTIGPGTVPEVLDITVAELATAKGGTLDSRLVRLTRAIIADTLSEGAWFVVIVADSTEPDTARIVMDTLISPNRSLYRPDRGIVSRGVIFPDGAGKWLLRPRPVAGEVVLD